MKRIAIALFTLVLLAPGCSLGPRQDWGDQIHDGAKVARRAGTARVRQSVALKVIETNIREVPDPLYIAADGVANFRQRRAKIAVTLPAKGKGKAFAFDDMVVFFPRSASSIGKGGRHWARFDFERKPTVDIDTNDRRLAIGVAVVSPTLAVDLLEGILTGSIRNRGTENLRGAPATRYHASISQDAAVREIRDEERRTGILRLFETIGVREDVFPVDVWMAADGKVRALRFILRQQKDVVNAFRLTLRWDFSAYGIPAGSIDLPKASDTLRSGRFRRFVAEAIREGNI
jgi:hypothetical protein